MIKIWGRPTSVCTQRVLWCMDELGVAYEPLILASGIMGPQGHISKGAEPYGIVDTPFYRAMNPGGTVPTMDDDGFILADSTAMISYLALRHPRALHDGTPKGFAEALGWGLWCDGHLAPPAGKLTFHKTRLAPHLRDPVKAEEGGKGLIEQLKVLDDHLAKQSYLVGDTLTIGDILVGPTLQRGLLLYEKPINLPNVMAWHKRLMARPAFQKHVAPREYHFDD